MMKKLAIYFFSAFVAYSVGLNGQNVFTSLDSALVACYPFSGNANDQSGNNLNGTVNNAVLVADRFGTPNSAYNFGGPTNTANIVVPGFSSYLNGTAVSLCFWTAKTSYNYDCAFLMTTDLATNRFALSVYYGSSSSPAAYWDYGDIYGNGRLGLSSNNSLPASGTWDHWVFTSSGTGMKAYKNGVLVGSKTSSSAFSTSTLRNLCIGGAVGLNGGILWYTGSLDDIRIYKRELLASEVSKLYLNDFTCVCPSVATPSNVTSINTLCAGSSFTLSAISTTSLQWYGSSSSTLSLGSGTSYALPSTGTAGTYTYYARASDGCSTTGPVPIAFTIDPNPTLQTIASSPTLCVGQNALLQAAGATNYTWLPGNSNSSTLNVSPTSSTTYTLVGESNGCVSSKTLGMLVINLPTLSIVANAPVVCEGNTVTLNAYGASNYTWQPGNMNTMTINISPSSTTIYTLTGLSSGCYNTTVITMPVVNLPTVSISGSSVICLGKTILLLATGASNYTWFPGNIQSPVLSASPTSDITYTVIGETAGCSNTAAISMTVANPPVISIVASSSSICPGSQVSFTASGASNYTWNTGNTTPVVTFAPANTTTYTVTGVDANNCSESAVASVIVNSVSVIVITSTSPGTVCVGEEVSLIAFGAGSYTWSNGAQANTATISPLTTTTITVTGVDQGNGCIGSQSYVQNVDACAGINNNGITDAAFELYPNPNSGRFIISIEKEAQIIIYNSLGEIVYNEQHSGLSEISLETENAGIYFVTALVDQQKLTRRFIKH